MFRNQLLAPCLFCLLLLTCPALASSPLGGFNGARPQALGNAYAGLADDAYAFYVNQAGLAGLKLPNFFSTYSQLDANTAFSALGGAVPGTFGLTVGLGYRRLSISGLQASSETVDNTDQEIALAVAKKIDDDFSLGAALRFIARGLSKPVPGFEGANGCGLACDVGVRRSYRPWLRLGLSLQDLGGRINYQDGSSADLPYELVVGGALDLFGRGALFEERNEIGVTLDFNKSRDAPLLVRGGVEWRLTPQLAVRAGLEQSFAELQDPFPRGIIYNNLTAGLGFHYSSFAVDYAMRRNGDPTGDVINYLSFGYEYAEPTAEAVRPAPEENSPLAAEASIPRVVRVKHFPDVPAKFWAREAIEMLATAGLMWGYTDGSFHPSNKVTLGEFETIFSVGQHVPPGIIADGQKLITRQEAADRLKLKARIDRPRRPLTRAELAVMIYQTDWAQAAIKRLPTLQE
ncbi:MAG: S-layer homology domain-containing protein [Candidatus Saganbacteria bacterium]|nr:S-layer homology domain-containing protein [Candidatus Saganbacteria bacterium]